MDHRTISERIVSVLEDCGDFVNHDRMMEMAEFSLEEERDVLSAIRALQKQGCVIVRTGKKGKQYAIQRGQ